MTDWSQCELVEEVVVPCVKGTQVPAYFVVAAGVGVQAGHIVSDVDKTVFQQITDYARDRSLPIADWSQCDAVENKSLVCLKGTNLPVYLAIYDRSEMVEARKIDGPTMDKLMTYGSEDYDEPVWTDQTITLTLDAEDIDHAYRALSSSNDEELLEKIGMDDDLIEKIGVEGETVGPLTITVTHRDAELMRSSIDFLGHVVGGSTDLAERIAVKLFACGIDPMPT